MISMLRSFYLLLSTTSGMCLPLPFVNERGTVQTPQHDPIQALSKRIESLKVAKDVAGLRQLVKDAKNEWLPTKNAEYFPIILELCVAVNTTASLQPDAYKEMRELVISVIDSPDEKPAEIVGKLQLLLQGDPEYSRGELKDESWLKERRTRTERWLMVSKSIHTQFLAIPDPSGPRYFRVSPPPETGFPDGVSPSAIKDSVLRKQYEDAIEKNRRNVELYRKKRDLKDFEMYFAKNAQRQLIEAYTKAPYNTPELEQLLSASILDANTRSAIVDEVKRRIDERTTVATTPKTMPGPKPGVVTPPTAITWRTDPRLQVLISIDLASPTVEDILRELRTATQVELTRSDEIQNHAPALGSLSVRGLPAWQVMNILAESKRVEGRWEASGLGYRLLSNGTIAHISDFENQPGPIALIPGGGSDRRTAIVVILGINLGLLIVAVAYWFVRTRRSHKTGIAAATNLQPPSPSED
ncbi:MAG: hypothetical protein C0467_27755 [Planctomycetaceae bacterium]|nr:hypothetical protein [Planctomycetaceae bacterium]